MGKPPRQAQVVIAGGGIVGCSTAYHLAKLGIRDVLLLERARLTSGSTFHAAGLVGQLRSEPTITELLCYSVELYESLEAETGLATGWKKCGGLRLACTEDRWAELRRLATTARSFGLEMHLLSPTEARDLWPLMKTDDLVGAAFLPSDGSANPTDITMALARGARMRGARIVENCSVTGLKLHKGAVATVETNLGSIRCESFVNCCGQWARQLGEISGVTIPTQSMEHQYLVTEPIQGLGRDIPTLRDPDGRTYFKEEVGGLVMGGYEPNPRPWARDGAPQDFVFQLLEEDFQHFQQLADSAMARVPALARVGIRKLFNGPEAFTPDGNFILGEAPEVRNYFVGAGFNAFGIAAAGGAGKALAEWIVSGEAPSNLWPVDIRRFSRHHGDRRWVEERTREIYAKHYTIAWPQEEHESGRPLRRSPLYGVLASQGACFGEKAGWERPNWFALPGQEPRDRYSFGRPGCFDAVGREHLATREKVTIADETSFSKFMVLGPDAEAAIAWICAGRVLRSPGHVTYTQMLNRRGGIECDLTVARLSPQRFYIVTGTAFGTHDKDWIRRSIPRGLNVSVVDMTSAYAVIALMGPRSRAVLGALCQDDLGSRSFPFGAVREIIVAGTAAMALRVTYVGELGWELHVPTDAALTLYQALKEAGAPHGISDAGYRAIESLRLEKGYRVWGQDVTPDDTPLEAGLGWATRLRSPIPFQGQEALRRQLRSPLPKRLVCLTVDHPDICLLGRETIIRNGRPVGWLTSGGWGYTVERNIGYGYVRRPRGVTLQWLQAGEYQLEVATELVPARLRPKALYDPENKRVKA